MATFAFFLQIQMKCQNGRIFLTLVNNLCDNNLEKARQKQDSKLVILKNLDFKFLQFFMDLETLL
jgi:hypothetical protein